MEDCLIVWDGLSSVEELYNSVLEIKTLLCRRGEKCEEEESRANQTSCDPWIGSQAIREEGSWFGN